MASNTRITQLTADIGFGGTGNTRVTHNIAYPGFNIHTSVRFTQLGATVAFAGTLPRVTQISGGIAVRKVSPKNQMHIIGPIT